MNLSGLLFLACPIGMGLMMWMMMRGQGQQPRAGQGTMTGAGAEGELSPLRERLQALQKQQTAIKAEIEKLSVEQPLGQ